MTAASRPLCVLALLATFGGAPAVAQAVPARAAAFVALVQANGCAMTEAQAQALLPPAGLTMADARSAAALMHRGRLFTVDDDGETLRLVPELCTAEAEGVARLLAAAAEAAEPGVQALGLGERVDTGRAAALVQLVRLNACAMTEAEASARLPALGFEREQVQDIAAVLFNGWMAQIEGDRLTLTPAACVSEPAADAAWIEVMLAQTALIDGAPAGPDDPATLRALLVMAAAFEECSLDPADTALAADLGLEVFGLTAAPEEQRAALARRLAALAADPGPAFRPDPDRPGRIRPAYFPE